MTDDRRRRGDPRSRSWGSASQRRRELLDDQVLLLLREVRVEREGEQSLVRALGLREVGRPYAEVGVYRVAVDGYVVHLHADALGAELVINPSPIVDPNGEEVIGVPEALAGVGRE